MTTNKTVTVRSLRTDKQNGYAALITVLVIAVVVMAIGLTLPLGSINEIQNALSAKKNEEALNFVESCVEDALLTINNDEMPKNPINLPEGSCDVTIDHTGPTWTLTVVATSSAHTKKVKAVVNRTAYVTITSWEEL